jgi:pimeloyl-ACP methyl ester carboxylesterase
VLTTPAGDGSPILLLSDLAVHSENLARDRRASLLLVGEAAAGSEAATVPRLTLTGSASKHNNAALRPLFLARHPEAAGKVMVVDMLPSPVRPLGVPPSAVKPLAALIGGEAAGADRLRRDLKTLVGRFGNSSWLESRNDAGVVGRSISELLATDLAPELPRIRASLTVVYACSAKLNYACGTVSRVFASAYSRRPGTRLVRIERSGHTILSDQPVAFQAELRRFLGGR